MLDTLAYLRVSDPRQATPDKVSLEDQRRELDAMASRLGRTLTDAGVFADPGVSGGDANRPGFQAMIAYCQANPRKRKDGVVLVYRDDRWGRFDDTDEAAHWSYVVRQCGYEVRFSVMDSENEDVRPFLRTIGRVAGRAERHKIQDRAKKGMRGAVLKGFWVNREPFAYRRVAVDTIAGSLRIMAAGQRKGQNETLKLTPGPDAEVAFVRWLFAEYSTGLVSIAELHAKAPTQFPRKWTWSHLQRILTNPVYVGDLRAGVKSGEIETVADVFPALVDRETFATVQRILERNRKATSPVRYGYPLSGLLTCATCGATFVGGGKVAGFAGDDPRSKMFYRESTGKGHRCSERAINFLRREVEPKVIAAIAGVISQQDFALALREEWARALDESSGAHEERQRSLTATRRSLEAKRDNLVGAVADGTLQRGEAAGALAAVRRDLDQVTAELERMRFGARRSSTATAELEGLVESCQNFAESAAILDGNALRELLRPWLQSAVVEKSTRTVRLSIRRVPVLVAGTFTPLADQAGEAATVEVLIHLRSRSEWATLREASRRATKLAELNADAAPLRVSRRRA